MMAHQLKHRHLRGEQPVDHAAQVRHLGFDAREALHQRDVRQRVGGALGERRIVALDLALQLLGLANDERGEAGEHHAQDHQQRGEPPVDEQRQRQQHEQRDERREMLAEERQPQPPQRVDAGEHHLHQPAGMRAAVERERQLQHVLEIVGEHGLAAAVREAVGMQRDQHAADDGEQAERHPGGEQRGQLREARRRVGGLRAHHASR